MVHSCGAVNCTARWKKGVNTKFHKIPVKNENLRKLWLHAIRRVDYNPKNGFICEKHFLESDYLVNVHGNKILKKGAIPSVFDFPQHLKKVVKERRALKRKHTSVTGQFEDNLAQQGQHHDQECDMVSNIFPLEGDKRELESVSENILGNPKPLLVPGPSQKQQVPRLRRDPIYFGDFLESDLENSDKRQRFFKVAKATVIKYKKLTKYYQCKTRRQKSRINNLTTLLKELKNKEKLSSSQLLVLEESIPEAQKQLLFRQIKRGSRCKFSPELKCFALTLHFYSAAAYDYVRKVFGKQSLPHPRTLAKWYSSVDGTPGYTAEALQAIKAKVICEREQGKELVVGLVMDEMSIREHLQWTGSRHVGFIDFGTGMVQNDSLPKAKNALVFMVVGINTRWKIPIAYFLVNSVTAEEKANFVKGCLQLLEEAGVLVKSLTFDGCAANISMCNVLGANLQFPNLQPFF